ncbi:CubicO group peptidase (beta-lactamase class C family) [Blastomonas natatoria]|uniref:CubicO group peptidase (Beta-lactamase class C family) n=1 Tax=Blastomonas natatoria TaxID=34015 RepID=A0A2V3V0D4_9SPHN|nr:serine hydrolase domain-containing protein [Blastomonas natatoria]PXW75226.1 CubicO group peptidase (beta-lactamase class C family) [Blastomonas natatoria]
MTLTVSDPADLGFNHALLERIPVHIRTKYLDTRRLPHAALLIGRGHELAHLSLQGDAREGQALQQDTIFRIASMTKPITSVAFMQLVEEGRIALSDPVHRIIPEWKDLGVFVSGGGAQPFVTRPTTQPMRMIDLLRHTSGLTYGFQERTPIDAAYRARKLEAFAGPDLEEFIRILAQIPLQFDPGTAWNYSISTDILGAILQRMDDKPLDEVIADRITKPLGMVDTHFQIPQEKLDRVPDCYVFHPTEKMKLYDPGATTAWGRKPSQLSGGGGMASTLADYHRFCRMLLNGGRLEGARILGRKTLDLMVANHLPGGGDLTQHSKALFSEAENAGAGFGLGFATTIDNAATGVAGSNGDFYWGGMFSTAFFVDPAEDVIMIFMTQLMPSSTYPIRREIKSMLYAAVE